MTDAERERVAAMLARRLEHMFQQNLNAATVIAWSLGCDPKAAWTEFAKLVVDSCGDILREAAMIETREA